MQNIISIEESNNSIASEILNHLSVEMAHLLKYVYQPTQQTSSWIGSIFNAYDEISKMF